MPEHLWAYGNRIEVFGPGGQFLQSRLENPLSPIIRKIVHNTRIFVYNWGVTRFEQYLDGLLARGRDSFSVADARAALRLPRPAFDAAAKRLKKKRLLARPYRNFFLILRPEDRAAGAPDPIRWIDALMSRIGVDYRVSLLKAAAIHGSSHQASMVFQVIVPKQLRPIEIGRHRIQFLSQKPEYFKALNVPGRLTQFKSSSGFVNAAGIELTILDSIRYFHRAAGINGAAQIAHDLGAKASPRKLARAAVYYENAAVRRLGYLFDLFGHKKQAKALLPFAGKAKSMKPLDPSAKSYIRAARPRVNRKWMLRLNQAVEIDR